MSVIFSASWILAAPQHITQVALTHPRETKLISGHDPDSRTLSTLHKHGIRLDHTARALSPVDFTRFDYILAMDTENLRNVKRIAPRNCSARICLFGDFTQSGSRVRVIEDPYYGEDDSGFHRA